MNASQLDYLAQHPSSATIYARAALTIAAHLSLTPEWSPDTLEEIAQILTAAGQHHHLPQVGEAAEWQALLDGQAPVPEVRKVSAERYLVTWAIDIDNTTAHTPEEAAEAALDSLTRPGSIAGVFTVHDNTRATTTDVDLSTHLD